LRKKHETGRTTPEGVTAIDKNMSDKKKRRVSIGGKEVDGKKRRLGH